MASSQLRCTPPQSGTDWATVDQRLPKVSVTLLGFQTRKNVAEDMKSRSRFTTIIVSLLWTVATAHVVMAEDGEPPKEKPIRVVSFSIIDTKTQKPIKGYERISKDDTIAVSSLPTNKINVRANVSGKPGSVRFVVPEEKVNRVESKAPYSLAGDIYGRFLRWTAKPGTYTLTAVPYESSSGRGTRGDHLQVKVKFTE